MYKTKASLVLASSSPRRRELLGRVGINFKIVPGDIEEEGDAAAAPAVFCQRWAREKAEAVAARLGLEEDHWYLGVDTVVVVSGQVLGKPGNAEGAREFLRMLSGRWHEVITGYCIFHPLSGKRVQNAVSSEVRIKNLDEAEIAAYAATGEPDDKAGGYGIQGIGAFMVAAVRGSYTNVVGLPLPEVIDDLKKLGIIEVETTR